MFASVILSLLIFVSCGQNQNSPQLDDFPNNSEGIEVVSNSIVNEKPFVITLDYKKPSLDSFTEDNKQNFVKANTYTAKIKKNDLELAEGFLICEKRNKFNTILEKWETFIPVVKNEVSLEVFLQSIDPDILSINCFYKERYFLFNKSEEFHFGVIKSYVIHERLAFNDILKLKNGHLNLKNLYILKDGELVFGDGPYQLSIEELHSQEGMISSFKYDHSAKSGHFGKSGPSLNLNVGKAFGHLNLELNGQNGGLGATIIPSQAKQGESGEDATSFDELQLGICPRLAGHGGDGRKGKDGNDGLPGGSTGKLILKINSESDFSLTNLSEGGRGGRGGEAQSGGLPGVIGHGVKNLFEANHMLWKKFGTIAPEMSFMNLCPELREYQPKPGRRGRNGVSGKNGAYGNKRDSIVRINNNESYY